MQRLSCEIGPEEIKRLRRERLWEKYVWSREWKTPWDRLTAGLAEKLRIKESSVKHMEHEQNGEVYSITEALRAEKKNGLWFWGVTVTEMEDEGRWPRMKIVWRWRHGDNEDLRRTEALKDKLTTWLTFLMALVFGVQLRNPKSLGLCNACCQKDRWCCIT